MGTKRKNELLLLEAYTEGFGLLEESDSGYIYPKSILNKLSESENHFLYNDDKITVDCILQKADTLNKNGRIYPKSILQKQVEVYLNNIENRSSMGETDHPEEVVISLKDPSHLVTKVWWAEDGITLMGTLELITSEKFLKDGSVELMGDKIATYLRKGIKLGISSRGLGTVKKVNGNLIVQDDFELVCFDIVSSPSTPGAYLHAKTTKINESVSSDNIQTSIVNEEKIKFTNKFTNKIKDFINKK